jgi:transcriptional regulator with XRE-family HTH domain
MTRKRRNTLGTSADEAAPRTFGQKLRAAREAIGYSRPRLAKAVKVSPDSIERSERYGRIPTIGELTAICDLFERNGVDLARVREIFRAAYPRQSYELHASAGSGHDRGHLPAHSPAGSNQIEDEFRGAEAARPNPALYEYLEAESERHAPMYLARPHLMMTKRFPNGLTVPIPVSILTDASKIRLGSLGEEDLSDPDAETDPYVRKVYAMAERKGRDAKQVLWNGAVYTMKGIAISADEMECTISCGLSDFYSTLSNHVAMEFELLSGLKEWDRSRGLILPKRRNFFGKPAALQRRHAALSLTALVVYSTSSSGGYKIMLCKRSEDVAMYRGLFGVIPGGMFGPEISPYEEWNIHHCLIKEYAEELFGLTFDRQRASPFYFFYDGDGGAGWKPALDLYRALKEGTCKIIYSGVILTMMDWLPQICCVMMIDKPEWYKNQELKMANNFENVPKGDFRKATKRARAEFDLDDFEAEFLSMREGRVDGAAIGGRWVPASLGSLWLGIKAVREYHEGKRPAAEFIPYLSINGLPEP